MRLEREVKWMEADLKVYGEIVKDGSSFDLTKSVLYRLQEEQETLAGTSTGPMDLDKLYGENKFKVDEASGEPFLQQVQRWKETLPPQSDARDWETVSLSQHIGGWSYRYALNLTVKNLVDSLKRVNTPATDDNEHFASVFERVMGFSHKELDQHPELMDFKPMTAIPADLDLCIWQAIDESKVEQFDEKLQHAWEYETDVWGDVE